MIYIEKNNSRFDNGIIIQTEIGIIYELALASMISETLQDIKVSHSHDYDDGYYTNMSIEFKGVQIKSGTIGIGDGGQVSDSLFRAIRIALNKLFKDNIDYDNVTLLLDKWHKPAIEITDMGMAVIESGNKNIAIHILD